MKHDDGIQGEMKVDKRLFRLIAFVSVYWIESIIYDKMNRQRLV